MQPRSSLEDLRCDPVLPINLKIIGILKRCNGPDVTSMMLKPSDLLPGPP